MVQDNELAQDLPSPEQMSLDFKPGPGRARLELAIAMAEAGYREGAIIERAGLCRAQVREVMRRRRRLRR